MQINNYAKELDIRKNSLSMLFVLNKLRPIVIYLVVKYWSNGQKN